LQNAIARIIEGVGSKALAERSALLSDGYRSGAISDRVIRDESDVAAYLTTRLPATYAAIAAALAAVKARIPRFAPSTLLDAGAGPGTASWAALETWPTLQSITMLDRNANFLSMARQLAQASDVPALQRAQIVQGDITAPELGGGYEVIIAGYAFAELSAAAAERALTALRDACVAILIIVEPGTPAGFARIRSARSLLLRDNATILAPCPGGYPCPINTPDWCHFAERLPRSRAHMRAKAARVPFEDEKFSYIAVARSRSDLEAIEARIIAPPHATKAGVDLKLCTAEGIVPRKVMKRDKAAFRAVARAKWGDAL
jgi:ribosomal protein RSM22 (predicted rRNA methylase)